MYVHHQSHKSTEACNGDSQNYGDIEYTDEDNDDDDDDGDDDDDDIDNNDDDEINGDDNRQLCNRTPPGANSLSSAPDTRYHCHRHH